MNPFKGKISGIPLTKERRKRGQKWAKQVGRTERQRLSREIGVTWKAVWRPLKKGRG